MKQPAEQTTVRGRSAALVGVCARAWRRTPRPRRRRKKRPSPTQPAPGGRPARPESRSQQPARAWTTTGVSSSCRRPIRSCAPKRCAAWATSTWKPARASAWPGEASTHRRAGRRGHQALHEPAQELSRLSAQRPGALPARARLRDHRPAGEGAGDARRRPAPLSAARRSWTKCSSAAASCCSRPGSIRRRRTPTTSSSSRATGSAFLTQSLYKHGWSLFKQGLNDDSLPSFAGVLDRTMLHEADTAAHPARQAAARQSRAGRRHAARHGGHVLVRRRLGGRHRQIPRRAQQPGVRARHLFAPRRPVRREGALPGRRRRVPRLRDARTEQRILAGPFACRPSRPTARAGSRELVLEGKREYVALYNYGTTFWQGRNKADYPNIARELKTNLKDVATYFHANAQKSKKVGRVPRGRALVPHLPRVLPGRSGFLRHQLPARPRRCTRRRTTRPRPPNSRRRRMTTRATRVRRRPAYAALGAYTKYEEKLPARPRRPRRTSWPWMPA